MKLSRYMRKPRTASLLVSALAVSLFCSCSEDLPTYQDTENRLNFYLGGNDIATEDDIPVDAYSFVYSGGLEKDTIWAKVKLMGRPSSEDRTISIKQVMTGENDAEAGKHYVDFADPSLSRFYVMKANEVSALIPVVVLRDKSLASHAYNLHIAIAENEDFKAGYPLYQQKWITLSDMLAKPSLWEERYISHYFAAWGPVAHQFMIDVTGQPFDDDFIDKITSSSDTNYIYYLAEKCARAKIQYNKEHPDAPLSEADGTPIKFGWEQYL